MGNLSTLIAAVAIAFVTGGWFGMDYQQTKDEAARAVVSEAARQKEANWQSDAQTIEEVHDEELRRVAAQHVRDLERVRDRAARLPAAAAPACNGATGAQLSRDDAAFLIGFAAERDAIASDLRSCQAWVETVTHPR